MSDDRVDALAYALGARMRSAMVEQLTPAFAEAARALTRAARAAGAALEEAQRQPEPLTEKFRALGYRSPRSTAMAIIGHKMRQSLQ